MDRSKLDSVPKSEETGVHGWETSAEEAALTALAGVVRPDGVIVELGSEYGRSMCAFLRGGADSITYVSVDMFPKDHPIVGDLLAEYMSNVGKVIGDGKQRVALMIGDSAEAGEHWDGRPIDLLFIDAGHEYEQVVRDILAWVKYVRLGGVVAFHDCAIDGLGHYLHIEVSRAIDDNMLDGHWEEHTQVDSIRVFTRTKEQEA